MRRDFSENAKTTLFNLIDQINGEQWFGWTDAIGDFFCWGLNIENYLNDLDSYHKKVMDKNDTTKEQIRQIFDDVNLVDSSYQSIFNQCSQTVTEQINYIKGLSECINPLRSNFNVEYMQKNIQENWTNLQLASFNYYYEKLKNGNGDGNYDYEYLREIMSMKPDEVPVALYAALITTFNDMNLEQKEEFIERSYICSGRFIPSLSYTTFRDIDRTKLEYNISGVFLQMTSFYSSTVCSLAYSNENEEFVSNFNIINAIACQANAVYITCHKHVGQNLEISLSKNEAPGSMINDITIDFNGSKRPLSPHLSLETELLSLNVYQMRAGGGIDGVFDSHTIELIDTLREDTGDIWVNVFNDTADDHIQSLLEEAEIIEIHPVVGVVMDVNDSLHDHINANITNNIIDQAQSLITHANIYDSFAMSANFSFRNDGTYVISCYFLDQEELDFRLKVWQEEEGVNIDFNANDIAQYLQTGNYSDVEGVSEFIAWYTFGDGESTVNERR